MSDRQLNHAVDATVGRITREAGAGGPAGAVATSVVEPLLGAERLGARQQTVRAVSRSKWQSGYYTDDGKLIYAGRAGTGLAESELKVLLKKLHPLASEKMTVGVTPPKTSRFGKPLELRGCIWCGRNSSPKSPI
jgi:hypothetical protein